MFGLRRCLVGSGGNEKRKTTNGKIQSWMMPVSHGYHVMEDCSADDSYGDPAFRELDPADKVVAQREQIQEHELWFFGVFDSTTGDGVSKYLQTHLFDKKLKVVISRIM